MVLGQSREALCRRFFSDQTKMEGQPQVPYNERHDWRSIT
jgi:hypothetical protein